MDKKLFVAGLLVLLLIIAACSKEYVCYDGTTADRERDCPTLPPLTVVERDAGRAADNYGQAYARAKEAVYTRVNLYREGADWFAIALFDERRTGNVEEIKLKIDGRTATVSCVQGCAYLGLEDDEPLNETLP